MVHRIAFALLLIVVLVAVAAPGPKERGERIEGQITHELDSPAMVLYRVGDGNREDEFLWLVFMSEAVEKEAANIPAGRQVIVSGTRGTGGQYRYLIVASVKEKP